MKKVVKPANKLIARLLALVLGVCVALIPAEQPLYAETETNKMNKQLSQFNLEESERR